MSNVIVREIASFVGSLVLFVVGSVVALLAIYFGLMYLLEFLMFYTVQSVLILLLIAVLGSAFCVAINND